MTVKEFIDTCTHTKTRWIIDNKVYLTVPTDLFEKEIATWFSNKWGTLITTK